MPNKEQQQQSAPVPSQEEDDRPIAPSQPSTKQPPTATDIARALFNTTPKELAEWEKKQRKE